MKNKNDLITTLDTEINDRTDTRDHLDACDHTDLTNEILALAEIKDKVQNETNLTYSEYVWLIDLCQ